MEISTYSVIHALAITGLPIDFTINHVAEGKHLLTLDELSDDMFLHLGMEWVDTVPMSKAVTWGEVLVFVIRYPNMGYALGYMPEDDGDDPVQRMLLFTHRWMPSHRGHIEGFYRFPVAGEEITH